MTNLFSLMSRIAHKNHFVSLYALPSSLYSVIHCGSEPAIDSTSSWTAPQLAILTLCRVTRPGEVWKMSSHPFSRNSSCPNFLITWVSLLKLSPVCFIMSSSLQANSILERHLIVSDRIYTMSELRNMSAGGDLILNTVRDQLKIRIMEHDKRKSSFLRESSLFFAGTGSVLICIP